MENLTADQQNYKAYVADRVAHGGWSAEDVSEYRSAVAGLMRSGTDDEKQAARDFWKLKAAEATYSSSNGINQRIRFSLELAREEQGEAA